MQTHLLFQLEPREDRKQKDLERKDTESGAQPNTVDLLSKECVEPVIAAEDAEPSWDLARDLQDNLFLPPRQRTRLTRRQKREESRERMLEKPTHTLDISAGELKLLKETNSSLATVSEAADGVVNTAGGFFKQNGLIYRHYVPPGCNMAVDQLVLPKQCRRSSTVGP